MTMIRNYLRFFRKKNQRKKGKVKNYRSPEGKKADWQKKWASPDFHPFWELQSFPESIHQLIHEGWFPAGSKVLDIGCGSGFLAAKLFERGYQVTGFDFAEAAIEKARQAYKERPGLKYIVADATAPLPFDDKFHIGIDRGTLHKIHPENHSDYASNIAEAIQPGGYLIIIFAKQFVKKIPPFENENLVESFKKYISTLFKDHFDIATIGDTVIESYNADDEPAFQVIMMKRKS